MTDNTTTAHQPYRQPRTWQIGTLLQITRGPSGPKGENHNRAHPAHDTAALLRPRHAS